MLLSDLPEFGAFHLHRVKDNIDSNYYPVAYARILDSRLFVDF